MYYFYVRQFAKDGCREMFLSELEKSGVANMIRAENGCIMYDFYLSEKNPNELLLVELWETHEHQQIHLTQPHMDLFREIKAKYIESSVMGENYPTK